jgi:ABC-type oligopeptide transport system substrate-binding subunit
VAAAAPRTFRFRITGDPETLDWNRAQTFIEGYLLTNTMEGLVGFDAKLGIRPALAESWKISEDRRTYTFKLRRGVLWSDGEPLRARDFVYGWKRLLSPVTGALYSYFLFDIEGAEYFAKGKLTDFDQVGVRALDDATLEVRLGRPVAHWINIPAFWVTYPVRQDVVERHGANWDRPGRVVTLGPYQLVAHEYGKKIVLRANPRYHGTRGNVELAEAIIEPKDDAALALYERGQLDFAGDLSSSTVGRLRGRSDVKRFPLLKTAYLGFSMAKFPVSSVNLRKAIAMAIDRAELARLDGAYEPPRGFAPPAILPPAAGAPPWPRFDPTAAKLLLRQSGLDPANPPKLEVITTGFDKQVMLTEFVRDQLKKNLGIELTIRTLDHREHRNRLHLGDFSLFMGSWGADYPDPDNFFSIFLSSSGNNRPRWKNPRYDSRVVEARALSDPAARARAYRELQRILLEEDVVICPLAHDVLRTLVHPRVRGLEINPQNELQIRALSL